MDEEFKAFFIYFCSSSIEFPRMETQKQSATVQFVSLQIFWQYSSCFQMHAQEVNWNCQRTRRHFTILQQTYLYWPIENMHKEIQLSLQDPHQDGGRKVMQSLHSWLSTWHTVRALARQDFMVILWPLRMGQWLVSLPVYSFLAMPAMV